jgi:hypothetical protein
MNPQLELLICVRATTEFWTHPLLAHQAAMPAQDGLWGDQAMAAQCSGQPPDEGGEHHTVRPVQAWTRTGTAEHGDLVSQHEQFDVLGGGRAAHQQDSQSTRWKIEYSSRSDTAVILPNLGRSPITAGQ